MVALVPVVVDAGGWYMDGPVEWWVYLILAVPGAQMGSVVRLLMPSVRRWVAGRWTAPVIWYQPW